AGSHPRRSSRHRRQRSNSSAPMPTSSAVLPRSNSSRRATSSSSCAPFAPSYTARSPTRVSFPSCVRCTSRSCASSSAPAGLDSTLRRDLFPHMPFRRFFDRGTKRESPVVDESSPDETEALEDESPVDEDDDVEGAAEVEGEPEDATEVNWLE